MINLSRYILMLFLPIIILFLNTSCGSKQHPLFMGDGLIIGDTIPQLKKQGIDYQEAFDQALSDNKEKIRSFMMLHKKTQGGGTLGHGVAIICLIRGNANNVLAVSKTYSLREKLELKKFIELGLDYNDFGENRKTFSAKFSEINQLYLANPKLDPMNLPENLYSPNEIPNQPQNNP